jgi:hypothetical protein
MLPHAKFTIGTKANPSGTLINCPLSGKLLKVFQSSTYVYNVWSVLRLYKEVFLKQENFFQLGRLLTYMECSAY